MLRHRRRWCTSLLFVFLILSGWTGLQADIVQFAVLHTNDFHGNLEPSGSNPGAARLAAKINQIRAAKEALGQKVILLDAGDIMQGALLSNVEKGYPTIIRSTCR